MANKKVAESTLSFQYNESEYEMAHAYPTYYRALGLEPRTQHPFCMYEGTMRQPDLVRDALEVVPKTAERISKAVKNLDFNKVLITGLGSSYQLGAEIVHLVWGLLGIPAEIIESSEALLSNSVYNFKNALVIGLSSSGNTVETVEHLKQARESGAYTLAFTNTENTRLTNAANDSFVSPGGYGLIYDFTSRYAPIVVVLAEIAKAKGRPTEEIDRVLKALADIPLQMQLAIDQMDKKCDYLGKWVRQDMCSTVIPASGNMLPIAWEMALRFEEMAHFPARGRPLIDFLHGGVGYIAPDVMTVILAPQGKTYEYATRAVNVARTIKAPCIAVIDADDHGEIVAQADQIIRIPKTHHLLKPMLYILPAQLIPYYTEVARPGGNPDAQRTDQPNYARAFDIAMPPKSH
jgi:glutamine---fructose-6-phosphate transaminase (isomerizing)